MKENFLPSLKLVLADEGKFSDIPEDRGGPTNLGITLKTLINYHEHFDYGDFDLDGDVDVADIRLLDDPEEAAPVYRRYFWDSIAGDKLPAGVDYLVFDSAVNHGPKNAGVFLQRAANRQGKTLLVDGCIGPVTIKTVQGCSPHWLISDILNERDIFYRKIVARDLFQEKFFKGWMNRMAHVAKNTRTMEG
ncbi:MAG: glycoside hydrolase family 108 protein [Desulfuromonadaceae bacterium]